MCTLIKKSFFTGLTFLLTLTSVNTLSSISMNNQECKVRPQIVNVNNEEPVFFPFSIKTSAAVNAAVVAAISIIHMQNCVFLMLLKI